MSCETKKESAMKPLLYIGVLALVLGFVACGGSSQSADEEPTTQALTAPSRADSIAFSADSAYKFVQEQINLGPRIPGSTAQLAGRDYLKATLSRFGATVAVQETTVELHSKEKVPCYNIIGSYNPEAGNRILLAAHWDSRPIADRDADPSKRKMPILGADDGASGVGVLLELARQLQQQPPAVGVDIIFFDVEDSGADGSEDSWCLGSNYFAHNPQKEGYKADFGILLDMVGTKDATFYWEMYSKLYAPQILARVWDTAISLGYGKHFKQSDGGYITDDHLPLNRKLGVPTINIVNFDPRSQTGFGPYWHTHDDNMEVIHAETLQIVGRTVSAVISEYTPQ